MKNTEKSGREDPKKRKSYKNPSDQTAEREGGDDAITNSGSDDSQADERVIVNEQRQNKTVNAPSQTAVNSSEEITNDEDSI